MTASSDPRDRFEDDLRSVLRALAPIELPPALGARVASVPYSRADGITWVSPVRRLAGVAASIGVVAAAVVIMAAVIWLRPATQPANGGRPRSALISSFVDQVDGVFGYRMLRPANWTPTAGDFPNGRLYLSPGSASQDQGVVLFAVNLSLPAGREGFQDVWQAFEQDQTLDGWTSRLQPLFDGSRVTLLRTLPNAKIYAMAYSGLSHVQLAAYVVGQGQPFMLLLEGNDEYADLKRLTSDGLVDADLGRDCYGLGALRGDRIR